MIDTVRFRIKIRESVYKAIQKKSVDFTKYDNTSGIEIFRISKNEVPLGSFDRKVSIFLPDEDQCFLEFSVPKFINGQNVYLINFDDFKWAIDKVYKLLFNFFGDFEEVKYWEVMRLDLCYAWKFQDELQAGYMLELLQSFNFSRKKKSIYDTSVMYIGQNYSLKFYLKYPEFYKHDFRILRDFGHLDLAYKMLDVSRGVLRFEATLRRKYLTYHLHLKKIYIEDLNNDKLWSILKNIFSKYMGGFNLKYKQKSEIKQILLSYYGKPKGRRLYMFYVFLVTEGKRTSKQFYSPSTVYQYMRELKEAQIPLTFEELKNYDMDLSIPSKYAVNDVAMGVSPRH